MIGPSDANPAKSNLLRKRDLLRARLTSLDLAARQAAEGRTRGSDELPLTHGRHATDWTRRHERAFQRHLAEIVGSQRNDRGALLAKIERQTTALRENLLRKARKARHKDLRDGQGEADDRTGDAELEGAHGSHSR